MCSHYYYCLLQVLGFDTETKPVFLKGAKPNPTALIQLACKESLFLSLSLYVYIYICMYIYIYIHIHLHIYIYIYIERER